MKKEIKLKMWGRIYILPGWVRYAVIAGLVAVALIVGFHLQKQDAGSMVVVTSEPTATPSPEASVTSTPVPTIYVYVVGEVKAPGVYELQAGAMVSQAVDAAGGLTENADAEAVNMVEILTVNAMIKVPAQGEATSQVVVSGDSSGSASVGGKVNINTAGVDELCTLSGVGESTAKKIIAYRDANGPFAAVEDIMNVPGIKEAKFMAIKEDICVG